MQFKSEKEFAKYLKILAEESVRLTYSKLSEAPEDDDIFGGEDLEGKEEDKPDETKQEKEPEETPEEPPAEKPSVEKVQIRPTPLTLELGHVTADGIISTLNMIRAGRSFKEADVAGELRSYIDDHLNDSQRLALATFLSALRNITSGEAASEVPSPDDENVEIKATDEERKQHEKELEKEPKYSPKTSAAPKGGDLEDTSAPIQVGQRNESVEEVFRSRIKKILSS